jgi:hypothetical protein
MQSSMDQFQAANGLRIGLALAKWDAPAATPTARKLLERALELTANPNVRGNAADEIYSTAGQLVAALFQAGDSSAWDLYGKLIASFESDSFVDVNVFRPLWIAPETPQAKKIASQMFASDSAFVRHSRQHGSVGYPIAQNIQSPC